ncbi:hypothetical protein Efla_007823 [Eimeria flavescens]
MQSSHYQTEVPPKVRPPKLPNSHVPEKRNDSLLLMSLLLMPELQAERTMLEECSDIASPPSPPIMYPHQHQQQQQQQQEQQQHRQQQEQRSR